ncbi:uncharacterized protein MYCFIDRAFT_130111, partial [Pseudocercospora fijiensis CIRAD86]
YASRFLQQSNARLSFTQDDHRSRSRNPLDRRRLPASHSRYVQRPGMTAHPYHNPAASQSRFPFASRLSRQEHQAPLFHSAMDDFEEQDAGEEYEREVADMHALQRSRQHFGPSNLTESSELEDDGIEKLDDTQKGQNHDRDESLPRGRIRGPPQAESAPDSEPSSRGKGRLVDINLNSTIDEEPPESLAQLSPSEPPKHDGFWSNLFTTSLCAMFAAFVLTWFQTSTPKSPLGDTIYTALRSSTSMLLWDSFIAVVAALIWLNLMRNNPRVTVFAMIVAVPVVLFAFTLYPLISSFKGSYHGNSIQDKLMRWGSFIPAIMAVFFTWSVIRNRHSLNKSVQILEFSTKVLAASPYLLIQGFITLGVVVCFSWIWMLMFERVFLTGTLSAAKKYILYANSWWLGAFFVLQYLWTLGVIAGVQRATTAATVSQWYFHRLAVPQPTSQEVVKASFQHAIGALFGTVCLSTFLSLLVRLPLIILPGRLSGVLSMAFHWIMPASVVTLTNPLTLTHAAIHSQPLGISAREMNRLNFTSRTNPSNTLGPRNFNPGGQNGSALLPYRLSKLLLQATRWIMSFALGFGGWVRAAHSIKLDGPGGGIRGSLYAYIIALIAGTIGFAVLGAVENVVGAVVDATVICWASESMGGRAEARFCREAGELFGEEGRLNLDDRRGMV